MKLKRKLALAFIACAFFLVGSPIAAFADSIDAVKVLNQHQFESHSVGGDIGRRIGWGVITGLHWLVGGIEGVVYQINSTIGGFFTSAGVRNLQQNKIMPLTVALMVLVILFIGILYIIKPRNFTTIAGNLVIGITIAIGLPALLSAGYTLTTQAIQFLDTADGKSTESLSSVLTDSILVDNITDNTMYDANGFKALTNKNRYAAKGADKTRITKIDPTETIDPGKMKYPDVWKNKLITDKDGKQSLSGLWDGKVGLISIPDMTQYYYRWNIDWFTVISTLVITGFALILSGIKIARLLYELAINQTLTQVIALLDIATAQRVKRCLQMLLSTLFTLFAVFFMLQLYIIGNAYIAKVSNPFLRLILMIALAWSVIDGPNLFEQIFGIDAGVHNAVRTMYGMKAAGSMMAGAATLVGGKGAIDSLRSKGVIGTAKAVVGKAGSAIGGTGGIATGMAVGTANNRQRYAAVRNGKSDPFGKQNSANHQTQPHKVPYSDKSDGKPSQGSTNGSSPAEIGSLKQKVTSSGNPVQGGPSANAPTAKAASAQHGSVSEVNNHQNSIGSQPINTQAGYNQMPYEESAAAAKGQPSSAKGAALEQQTATLGGYVGSKVAKSVRNSGAARSARRMYSLAYGSSMAHGDKKVRREALAYQKIQDNPDLRHSQAVHQAKIDIRNAKIQEAKGSGNK